MANVTFDAQVKGVLTNDYYDIDPLKLQQAIKQISDRVPSEQLQAASQLLKERGQTYLELLPAITDGTRDENLQRHQALAAVHRAKKLIDEKLRQRDPQAPQALAAQVEAALPLDYRDYNTQGTFFAGYTGRETKAELEATREILAARLQGYRKTFEGDLIHQFVKETPEIDDPKQRQAKLDKFIASAQPPAGIRALEAAITTVDEALLKIK